MSTLDMTGAVSGAIIPVKLTEEITILDARAVLLPAEGSVCLEIRRNINGEMVLESQVFFHAPRPGEDFFPLDTPSKLNHLAMRMLSTVAARTMSDQKAVNTMILDAVGGDTERMVLACAESERIGNGGKLSAQRALSFQRFLTAIRSGGAQ